MANRAVLQPNGLYARFSDVVDNFTHINCSREELIGVYTEMIGRGEAEVKLDRADAAGPARFQDCIQRICSVHGKELAEKVRCELSPPAPTAQPEPHPLSAAVSWPALAVEVRVQGQGQGQGQTKTTRFPMGEVARAIAGLGLTAGSLEMQNALTQLGRVWREHAKAWVMKVERARQGMIERVELTGGDWVVVERSPTGVEYRTCLNAADPSYGVDYGIGHGHICGLCNGTGVVEVQG